MKKFIKICEAMLFIIFLVILLFTKSKLSILLTIPIILLIYLLTDKIKIKNYCFFLFITSFIIRIISISILKVEIVDDFKTMLDASKSLIDGNLSFINTFYFKTFSYQLGHVLYQALLLKIFNKVILLKVVNSITTSLIIVFIYLNAKKIFKEEIARIVSLGYIFYLYPLYLNSILTNQHIPSLIYLVVIYLLLNKKSSIKLSIIIGLLLSISNILRTESIVFILGIIIFNLINIDKKTYKEILKNTSVLLLTYFIFNALTSQLIYLSPINTKLSNNSPYWKFYCGLSYDYNGLYNSEDEQVFFTNDNQKELLINRIKEENIKLPVLFLKKEVILWTQTNYDIRITNDINKNIYKGLLNFNQGYLNLIILLFVISLIPQKKETDKKILFIKILLGIYFGVYMFIEISPRYAYILHILIFLILGISIERITKIIKKLLKRNIRSRS